MAQISLGCKLPQGINAINPHVANMYIWLRYEKVWCQNIKMQISYSAKVQGAKTCTHKRRLMLLGWRLGLSFSSFFDVSKSRWEKIKSWIGEKRSWETNCGKLWLGGRASAVVFFNCRDFMPHWSSGEQIQSFFIQKQWQWLRLCRHSTGIFPQPQGFSSIFATTRPS